MKFIYKITFLLLLFPLISSANIKDKKHEKKKVINKEYKVNADARVNIINRYGNLNITTWDENRVEIKVIITVKGDDLESVENKLASINVDFENSSSLVYAKTIFDKEQSSWSFWKKSNNVNYQVDYKVKMPKTNSADLDNDYGGIFLDDLIGKAIIDCDYGSISIGELHANSNTIDLDYCSSSTIGYIKKGNISADYSKITIEEAENLKTSTDYTTLKIGKVNNIDFSADYGSISIEEATDVNGNSDYVSMRFGIIKKNLIIDTDYGAVSIKRLVKGFNNIDIDAQYAGVRINVDADAVFDFDLDLQYASFKGEDDKMEYFKKISKTTQKYYEGKFGKGNSNSKITIRSQYGGVSIKEN